MNTTRPLAAEPCCGAVDANPCPARGGRPRCSKCCTGFCCADLTTGTNEINRHTVNRCAVCRTEIRRGEGAPDPRDHTRDVCDTCDDRMRDSREAARAEHDEWRCDELEAS